MLRAQLSVQFVYSVGVCANIVQPFNQHHQEARALQTNPFRLITDKFIQCTFYYILYFHVKFKYNVSVLGLFGEFSLGVRSIV